MRYPGGVIRQTPIVPSRSAASGVWTLGEALQSRSQALWPTSSAKAEFTASASSTSDLTTYTFAGQSLGAVVANRMIVVVGLAIYAALGTPAVSSVTIGGVTATVLLTTGTNMGSFLAYALVPTGTTGDIVVTLGSGGSRCGVGIWRVYDQISNTPTDTDTPAGGADSARSVSIDVSAGGIIIAGASSGNASIAWTNATEGFDTFVEGGTDISGADYSSATAQAAYSITATDSRSIVAASWR